MTTVWVSDVDHLRQGCFYFTSKTLLLSLHCTATECGAIHVIGKYVLRHTLRHAACNGSADWMQLVLPPSVF
jgi:hypothetical protein